MEVEVLQLPHHGERLDMGVAVVTWRGARWSSGVGCSRCVGNQGQGQPGGEEGVGGGMVRQLSLVPSLAVPLFALVVTLHPRLARSAGSSHMSSKPRRSMEVLKLPLGAFGPS